MKRHAEEAKLIAEAFEILSYACYNIKDYDACEDCPRRHMCLEDTESSIIENADLVGASAWEEFLDYSYNAHASDEVRKAEYADMMRKMDIEERMIDDEYGG